MNNWNEAKEGKVVYVKEPIEFGDDNDSMHFTKPFQKAEISDINSDHVAITISNGEYEGEDFYFYFKDSSPSDLLTAAEMRDIKNQINIDEVIELFQAIKIHCEHRDREEANNEWNPKVIQKGINILKEYKRLMR